MKKGKCPYFGYCPHLTAMCAVYLPDKDCPLYKYLKKIIESESDEDV